MEWLQALVILALAVFVAAVNPSTAPGVMSPDNEPLLRTHTLSHAETADFLHSQMGFLASHIAQMSSNRLRAAAAVVYDSTKDEEMCKSSKDVPEGLEETSDSQWEEVKRQNCGGNIDTIGTIEQAQCCADDSEYTVKTDDGALLQNVLLEQMAKFDGGGEDTSCVESSCNEHNKATCLLGGCPEARTECEKKRGCRVNEDTAGITCTCHMIKGTKVRVQREIPGKFKICQDLPGIGMLSFNKLVLKSFNGRIQISLDAGKTRLLAYGPDGEPNVAQIKSTEATCGESTNVMVLELYFDGLKVTYRQKKVGEDNPTANKLADTKATLSLKLAIDAKVRGSQKFKPSDQSHTQQQQVEEQNKQLATDFHVCIPDIGISTGGPLGLLATFLAKNTDLNSRLEKKLYCLFKYTLPNTPHLGDFMAFLQENPSDEPQLTLVLRNTLLAQGKEENANFATKLDGLLQLKVPTMPFAHFIVQQGTVAIKAAAAQTSGSSSTSTASDQVAQDSFDSWRLHSHQAAQTSGSSSTSTASDQVAQDRLKSWHLHSHQAAAQLQEKMRSLTETLESEENQKLAQMLDAASKLIFDLENGFIVKSDWVVELMEKNDKNERTLQVAINELDLAVSAQGTQIPLAMLLEPMVDLAGVKAAVQALKDVNDNTKNKNVEDFVSICPTKKCTIKLLHLKAVQLVGDFMALMKRSFRERFQAQYVQGAVNKRYFNAWMDFLDNPDEPVSFKIGTQVTDGIISDTIQRITTCGVDKTSFSCGGIASYSGPLNTNTIMSSMTEIKVKAAEAWGGSVAAAEAAADSTSCLQKSSRTYDSAFGKALTVRKADEGKCGPRPEIEVDGTLKFIRIGGGEWESDN